MTETNKSWTERFDERFPEPEHDRYSKCSCSSEAEHNACFAWAADRDEVKEFIGSLLAQEYKRGEEAAEAKFIKDLEALQETIKADVAKEVPPVLETMLAQARKEAQEKLIEAIKLEKRLPSLWDDESDSDRKDGYNQAIDEITAHLRALVEGRVG